MTPKQQADDLWYKFDEIIALNSWADEKTDIKEHVLLPKKCSLLLVNEVLAIFYNDSQSMWLDELSYWHEVKNEIEKL